MVVGGTRLGGLVGFSMVGVVAAGEKVSKILAAFTWSSLRRESDFELSIVVFMMCTCF